MIWQNAEPYDEWLCTNAKCPHDGQLWRNQDHDDRCQWCREPRVHVGRFATHASSGLGKNWRLNLATMKIEYTRKTGIAVLNYPPDGVIVERVGIRGFDGNVDS